MHCGRCWEAASESISTPGASQLKQLHWNRSGVFLNTLQCWTEAGQMCQLYLQENQIRGRGLTALGGWSMWYFSCVFKAFAS